MLFTLTDDLNNKINFSRVPGRIVSLVPSLTETFVHLGALDKLAGVTDYCIHPAGALNSIPRVGGTKNPSIEKILSLEPDLVIANAEENEKDHVQQLKKHVRVFVTFPRTIDGALGTVLNLGTITESEVKAKKFVEDCRHFLASHTTTRVDRSKKVPARTMTPGDDPRTTEDFSNVCLVWRKPWMAAGVDTYISDLLQAFGFANIIRAREERYPVIVLEELALLRPQIILLPNEPYNFQEEHREEIEQFFERQYPTLHETGCKKETHLSIRERPKILLVDGTMLAWFGWRSRRAFDYLIKLRQSASRKP